MDLLAKQAAEIALRLAALQAGAYSDPQALDAVERLASDILREVSMARARATRPAGEVRGVFRAMQPAQRY